MILVDTSVWIEFFRGKEPYFSKLVGLVEASEVIAHEVVFGEILQGCKNKSEIEFVLHYWRSLNNILSNGAFIKAGNLSFEKKHFEKGIGIIDSILIYETKQKNLKLWTLDKKILKVLESQYIYPQ
ncbi:PIN domain-containing protein [Leptospira bourretii]|uniref:PIN domain-containing protein n=1 Tax=Leptospira bourretii TaxID=2484962 RepID=A0A4R9IKX3_9LEPT|nr:PIN domain-containing protein [Leptospira bourretii]TGK79554.1 PIN domain-containing protein [Leptospira bourretii]TGK89762.1 PIN domain-containing protein [Leptospira bourretii]TGL19475.1 PIN domain-containing protein [Leptospira bourretii]TGL35951.1 PIN domain-containing protein [Leptospira bourretii]